MLVNMADEQIVLLNKITAIIDEKAAKYKDELADMPRVRAVNEKRLIVDLIDEALALAESMKPAPFDLIADFKRLKQQLNNLH